MKKRLLIMALFASANCFSTKITATPLLSEKAFITATVLKETFLYDIPTQRGQLITLVPVVSTSLSYHFVLPHNK